MKRLEILFCVLGLFEACKPSVEKTTIAFEIGSKPQAILIPVTIGDLTYKFFFDTGAQNSLIVDSDLMSNAHKKNAIEVEWSYADIVDKSLISHPEKVKIDRIILPRKVRFALIDTIKLKGASSIAGNDIIQQLYWLFDFATMQLTISRQSFHIENLYDWIRIPYALEDNFMKIQVVINDTVCMGSYILDTGMPEYSDDGKPVILHHDLPNSKRSKVIGSKILNAGYLRYQKTEKGLQDNYGTIWFLCDSLTLFGHCISDCIISSRRYDGRKETWSNNIITLSYIRQFERMYLDTRKRIIYLKPWAKT